MAVLACSSTSLEPRDVCNAEVRCVNAFPSTTRFFHTNEMRVHLFSFYGVITWINCPVFLIVDTSSILIGA